MFDEIQLILIYFQSAYEITPLTNSKIGTAISPIWDDHTQSLYFIDLTATGEQPSIFRYSSKGVLYPAYIEGAQQPTGFITPVRQKCKSCKNLFAVGIGHDIVLIEWDGKSPSAQMVRKLSSVDSNDPMSRTDLARPDRSGRLYGGTFSSTFCTTPRNKTFYRYTSDKGLVRLFTDIYTTSGVAFNEDAQKLYHVDVCLLLITEFDWDPATGDLCNFLMLQLTLNL